MKKNCLIVDDEHLAINVIKKFLSKFEHFQVVGTASSAIEALKILSEVRVDVIFLDINMPVLSGIDFIKSLGVSPVIVITTAYREYAVESYEYNVCDYLVKPIAFPRFAQAINKIDRQLTVNHFDTHTKVSSSHSDFDSQYIFIKVDKKMIKLFLNDVIYIESLKNYIRVKTASETLITHNNMTGIMKVLPENQFLRIHRSYIVAIKAIKAINGNNIEIGDKLLPIGRNYQKIVRDFLLYLN